MKKAIVTPTLKNKRYTLWEFTTTGEIEIGSSNTLSYMKRRCDDMNGIYSYVYDNEIHEIIYKNI